MVNQFLLEQSKDLTDECAFQNIDQAAFSFDYDQNKLEKFSKLIHAKQLKFSRQKYSGNK